MFHMAGLEFAQAVLLEPWTGSGAGNHAVNAGASFKYMAATWSSIVPDVTKIKMDAIEEGGRKDVKLYESVCKT